MYTEVAKKPEVIYNLIQLTEINEKLILLFYRFSHLRIKFLWYTLQNIKTLSGPYVLFDFGETGGDALLDFSRGPHN